MTKYDFDRDIFDFPLLVNVHGDDLWLMVQAAPFPGGVFYTVRGDGMVALHVLCTFDGDQKDAQSHFTVMNEDTADNAVVTAIVYALRQPPDEEDSPNTDISG